MKWILSAILFSALQLMSQNLPPCSASNGRIIARRTNPIVLDARRPAHDWQRADAVTFCSDWQGKNSDPALQTTVRVLWNPGTIYLRFECRYREIFVFPDSDPNGRRDKLWDRDVAEAFFQPNPASGHYYKEFEVSPNGMWIDLDIFPTGLADLKSGMQRSVWVDDVSHTWAAEIGIPMNSITPRFDSKAEWRVNFYRVERKAEPRFYSAWQPTNTPEPNFHVPSAFGRMKFAEAQ